MSETNKKNLKTVGFTLIELMLVIAIIGLLASVVLAALATSRSKARDAKRVADVQQMSKGLELYFSLCNSFPQLAPATVNFVLNSANALYTGTAGGCGNDQGVTTNGGIGPVHVAGANETLVITPFDSAPQPPDDGTLAIGSRCSELNSATASQKWNDFSYVSFGANQYWLYFCIGSQQGTLAPGRYIMTERGLIQYSGNAYP